MITSPPDNRKKSDRSEGTGVSELYRRYSERSPMLTEAAKNDTSMGSALRLWWSRSLFPVPDSSPIKIQASFTGCLLLLAAIAGLLLFLRLDYPLIEPDEGRYAEIGREMWRSGDWIIPTMNHEPYYDKPPLLYWLLALSLNCFGTHAWSVRLVPATAAWLTVLATFWFSVRSLGLRAGFLSALVLALMAGFVQSGRFLLTDGVLTLFEALSLWTGYEALRGSRVRPTWWLASAAFCGLGVLTKGPIGYILVVVPLFVFSWVYDQAARIRPGHWIGFLSLSACLAAPWYVAIALREPGFARQFFIEHHLLRFFGSEYHEEPAWFYIPVVLVACLPWSFLLFPMARFLFSRSVACLRPPMLGFMFLWAAWCLLFFSLSRGKLPTYILPATPALAVLLGWYLDVALFQLPQSASLRPVRQWVPRLSLFLVGLGWLTAIAIAWRMGLTHPMADWRVLLGGIVCLVCFGGVLVQNRMLNPITAWIMAAAVGFVILLGVSQSFVPAWSSKRSPLAEVGKLWTDRPVAAVCDGEDWGSVPFQVDESGEFFSTAGRTRNDLLAFLHRHSRTLLFVKKDLGFGMMGTPPPGLQIAGVIDSGKARVYIVEGESAK